MSEWVIVGPVPDSTITDYFTFGSARFTLSMQDRRLLVPIPRRPLVGEWVHIPYGSNVFEGDGTRLHCSWQPVIELLTDDDYQALLALDGRVAHLTKPDGNVMALLRECGNLQYRLKDGAWVGAVTWEWE